ncbi:MAG: thiamine phosphate synthase, partial [Clostridiales bacterium]
NDDLDLALALDADGLHIGQNDLQALAAREKLTADKILGVSVQTLAQALEAKAAGADYLGVGAVFPTSSKDNAILVGHQDLKAIADGTGLPIVAIGGIGADNIQQLAGKGISGIAVISAILAADDIAAASRLLAEKIAKVV